MRELSLHLRRLKMCVYCVSFRMKAHALSTTIEITFGSLILNWINRLQTIRKLQNRMPHQNALLLFFQSQLVAVGPLATLVLAGVLRTLFKL